MTEIWNLVLACIVSAGGIGAIMVSVIVFTSKWIAKELSKRYELKLNKELERYKAGIDNKIYISKTKFDTEFQLYRQLSKSFMDMVKAVSQLFPIFTRNGGDAYDKYKCQYDETITKIIKAQDELCESAAFISVDLYKMFIEIESLCKQQLNDFVDFKLASDATETRVELRDDYMNAYKRTREIEEKFEKLLENMRAYISRLDVIE